MAPRLSAPSADPEAIRLWDHFVQLGHLAVALAGATLLLAVARMGVTFRASRAYRMGGDEFCVLLTGPEPSHEAIVDAGAAALRESGEGFAIAASYGSVRPARDVATAAEALQVADQRMYGHKLARSAARGNDARDVLIRVLHERQPELHDHITSVAALAREVGVRLALEPESVDELSQAAELHDIGKMAIPDTILTKPGPLDEDEWSFLRRHTLIGEAIPVAARIVAVCDAYDAMISDRSYRRGMSSEAAVEELRRSAGSQFDPRIVETFCAVLAEPVSADRRLAA